MTVQQILNNRGTGAVELMETIMAMCNTLDKSIVESI